MADRQVRPEDLAERLGVGVQTIYNWRSAGVPERKIPHLRQVINEWDARSSGQLGALVVRPTPEEFRAWNRAALDAGQLIEDWVIQGLNELAEESMEEPPQLKVAEDETPYRAVKRSGE